MTLDEAFAALGAPDGDCEWAMHRLLDEWESARPRCLALLHAYARGTDLTERTERTLFYIAHLLAEKADQGAFEDLCTVLGDPERADLVFGDVVFEGAAQIQVSCFNGNDAPLRALIENTEADPVLRGRTLLAMAYLTAAKRISRTSMHAYLIALYTALERRDNEFLWFSWITAAGLLGFGALSGRVADLFTRGLISPQMIEMAQFQDDLRDAAANPGSLAGFEEMSIGPLENAIEAVADSEADADFPPPPEVPYINPLRNVGRNDPCPCGSGKKYKKCCLP